MNSDAPQHLPPGLFTSLDGITRARSAFRTAISGDTPVLLPGIVDALTARLVERAGFSMCYATGAGIANVQLGMPDVGMLTLTEMVEQVRRIVDAVAIPVVVDADTGHGGMLSVMRTVHLLEQSGAAAIQIEDQAIPKRCGHFDGHRLVSPLEMQQRIEAACRARNDPALAIIARTDAVGTSDGIEGALKRAHLYLEAGADVLFVEAPESIEHMRRIGEEFSGVPLVLNVVEGGLTPQLSAAELGELGFNVILYANFLMRSMLKAGQDSLESLRLHGDSKGLSASILPWQERQALVNLPVFSALEDSVLGPGAG